MAARRIDLDPAETGRANTRRFRRIRMVSADQVLRQWRPSRTVRRGGRYFTSNRRADDQAPGAPDASTARTLHHIRVAGSVLVENVEAETVWFTVGEENVFWLAIWMT